VSELKGISPSTLASMLKDLEKEDLVEKEVFREIPPRVEYSLSSRGRELREAIIPLLKWATRKSNYKVHCTCSLVKR
jgi:DNA-binding HxlR family transcriptional regulator